VNTFKGQTVILAHLVHTCLLISPKSAKEIACLLLTFYWLI
jgi:hypothetical protein